jgi:hypothetical protein
MEEEETLPLDGMMIHVMQTELFQFACPLLVQAFIKALLCYLRSTASTLNYLEATCYKGDGGGRNSCYANSKAGPL